MALKSIDDYKFDDEEVTVKLAVQHYGSAPVQKTTAPHPDARIQGINTPAAHFIASSQEQGPSSTSQILQLVKPKSKEIYGMFKKTAKKTGAKGATWFSKLRDYTKQMFKKYFSKPEIVETYEEPEMQPAKLEKDLVDAKVLQRYQGGKLPNSGFVPDENVRQQRRERRNKRLQSKEKAVSENQKSDSEVQKSDEVTKAEETTASTTATNVVESSKYSDTVQAPAAAGKAMLNPLFVDDPPESEGEVIVAEKPDAEVAELDKQEAKAEEVETSTTPIESKEERHNSVKKKKPSVEQAKSNPLFVEPV